APAGRRRSSCGRGVAPAWVGAGDAGCAIASGGGVATIVSNSIGAEGAPSSGGRARPTSSHRPTPNPTWMRTAAIHGVAQLFTGCLDAANHAGVVPAVILGFTSPWPPKGQPVTTLVTTRGSLPRPLPITRALRQGKRDRCCLLATPSNIGERL